MKEFAYNHAIDNDEAKKIVRKLIYIYFKSNIRKKRYL